LESYQDIFREPKGLPLSKSHKNFIPLNDGAQLISPMPYKYFGLQKDIMEIMFSEMLVWCHITQSSFFYFFGSLSEKEN